MEIIHNKSESGLGNCLEQCKLTWAKNMLGTTLKISQHVQSNFSAQESFPALFNLLVGFKKKIDDNGEVLSPLLSIDVI